MRVLLCSEVLEKVAVAAAQGGESCAAACAELPFSAAHCVQAALAACFPDMLLP